MLYAIRDGRRAAPRPNQRATCPVCGSEVLSKCGEVNRWHWSHASLADCDAWSDGVSAWHLEWQSFAPECRREVVIGPHRADVVSPTGTVVELQRSPISTSEIREREKFYKSMIWIFDASQFKDRFFISHHGTVSSFKWYRPRPSLLSCNAKTYFDFGTDTLVAASRPSPPLGGYSSGVCFFYRKDEIIKTYFSDPD